ncbi:MAG: D-alanyl-D-alanine carboxypeptidase [Clostridia bacterium]|nr:D-alanyl-D-alanine carboxypeptidase [Clostridia bacterium]
MKHKIILFTLILFTCFSFVFASETLNINSKTAIAMDADSEIILYSKDMNKKIYPASTTKILTAILAIENLDLNKSVVVSTTAIAIPWDSSSVYLKQGEVITINDLLYCLLLNSGNDAANVLAESVSGDIQTFVKLMNIKAKELGCTGTHFNNAHGYSDDNHYTTALDMAKIFRYCIQNDTFVKIISTKSYIVEETNKTNEKRYLNNTNRLILKKEDSIYARFYEYCIGGKTGYTDEAGRTLVTFAKKDDKTVIVTTFGASSSGSQDVRYTDAINLFEYSFNNFSKQTIAEAENYSFNYINTDKRLNYSIGLKEDLQVLLKNNQTPDVSYAINIDETNLKDLDEYNIKEVTAGTITFNLTTDNGTSYTLTQDLYLKDIQKYSLITNKSILPIIAIIAVILLVLFVITIIIVNRKKIVVINNKSRKNRRIK